MRHFFSVYKQLEGKETAVDEVMGQKSAVRIVRQCIENYDNVFGDEPLNENEP